MPAGRPARPHRAARSHGRRRRGVPPSARHSPSATCRRRCSRGLPERHVSAGRAGPGRSGTVPRLGVWRGGRAWCRSPCRRTRPSGWRSGRRAGRGAARAPARLPVHATRSAPSSPGSGRCERPSARSRPPPPLALGGGGEAPASPRGRGPGELARLGVRRSCPARNLSRRPEPRRRLRPSSARSPRGCTVTRERMAQRPAWFGRRQRWDWASTLGEAIRSGATGAPRPISTGRRARAD